MSFARPITIAALRVVMAAGALYLFLGFFSFGNFPTPSAAQMARTTVAVVLGGGESRISAGLKLIDKGAIRRLFISGDNLDAYKSFVSFYSWRNPELKDVGRLLECCIEWSRKARSTIENARESQCWLTTSGLSGPILLITSPEHMGRALLIFENELPDRTIIPYPAPDPWHPKSAKERMRDFALEYAQYLATRAYYWVSFLGGRGLWGRRFC